MRTLQSATIKKLKSHAAKQKIRFQKLRLMCEAKDETVIPSKREMWSALIDVESAFMKLEEAL